MKTCKRCGCEITGRKRNWCSEACKQAFKYEKSKGERCDVCFKRMEPRPVLGGFIPKHRECQLKEMKR